MRDLVHSIAVRASLPPAACTSTISGLTVDRRGFESVTFLADVGDWTDGTHVLSAEHSADGQDWAPVGPTDLLGAFPVIKGDSGSPEDSDASAAMRCFTIGYLGLERYVRARTTITGSPADGAVYGVAVLLGHAHQRPTG